ncbi:hypothetical protein DPMN_143619 [Dreissena polymorpha]|uniref:Uncharacterized protein n=1 Tax=Dreissena polymorpha TaxID=45954 RepID=A0A9D4GGL8_DREPO|nr:hypothetical protein DPMN_143619 [Dreissena polymorpha]
MRMQDKLGYSVAGVIVAIIQLPAIDPPGRWELQLLTAFPMSSPPPRIRAAV